MTGMAKGALKQAGVACEVTAQILLQQIAYGLPWAFFLKGHFGLINVVGQSLATIHLTNIKLAYSVTAFQ